MWHQQLKIQTSESEFYKLLNDVKNSDVVGFIAENLSDKKCIDI